MALQVMVLVQRQAPKVWEWVVGVCRNGGNRCQSVFAEPSGCQDLWKLNLSLGRTGGPSALNPCY